MVQNYWPNFYVVMFVWLFTSMRVTLGELLADLRLYTKGLEGLMFIMTRLQTCYNIHCVVPAEIVCSFRPVGDI